MTETDEMTYELTPVDVAALGHFCVHDTLEGRLRQRLTAVAFPLAFGALFAFATVKAEGAEPTALLFAFIGSVVVTAILWVPAYLIVKL